MNKITLTFLTALLLAPLAATAADRADIMVYGGTPAGLAAARAAVREGAAVIVVEPTAHIGGMITGGIGTTDTGTPQLVGGISREFFEQVAEETGPQGPASLLFHGKKLAWRQPRRWDLEPKVARRVFEQWVSHDGYKLMRAARVQRVTTQSGRITSTELADGTVLQADIFIDASYEGDLMARAGVTNTYGREAAAQYGEKLAGVQAPHFVKNYTAEEYETPTWAYMHHGQFGADLSPYDAQGRLLWGIEKDAPEALGSGDQRLQAYCYRLIATQRPEVLLPWPKPANYHPERYELLLRYIQAHPNITFTRLVHLDPIPNGKFDLNASGPFSIDYVGGNWHFPVLSYAERDRMLQDHEDYEKGFLWFLANDPRVPERLRTEARSWGLAKDEWPDHGNWPAQLYIRESRRMIGQYVMTEHDILTNRTKEDSVGMGSFLVDSHWVRRIVNAQGFVRMEGHLDKSIKGAPYEIPYRSLTPKPVECRNLLVPVCISATHVAICTVRMEPVYMILGHSAGVAAAMAAKSRKAVQEIDVAQLTRKLRAQNQVLNQPAVSR